MKIFYIAAFCLTSTGLFAQTQFWSDTFEDAGAPSTGARTASVTFSCSSPATSYFFRTTPAGIATQSGTYSGLQGLKIWAAEDIDRGATCTNNSISANQTVTWSNINITNKLGLSFKGLFAANSINGAFQGLQWAALQDKIEVEYRINGGSWTKIIGIYSNDGATTNSSNVFSLDTDNDMIGDGAALSYTFREFSVNITGTGTTLDLRLTFFANAGTAQEIAVDNFRLFNTAVLPVNLVNFSGTPQKEGTLLEWSTAEEVNNNRFDIERSIDGDTYEVIASVPGKGNSILLTNYLYTDKNLFPVAYYRLKQVDLDGRFDYSKVVQVKNDYAGKLMVYPNPFGAQLVIDGLLVPEITQVKLFSISGKQVTLPVTRTGTRLEWQAGNLQKGMYMLQWYDNNSVKSRLVIKQ